MSDTHKGWHSRGYIPHCDEPGRIQMITFRLADSLPKSAMEILKQAEIRVNTSEKNRISECLDLSYGECHLKPPQIGKVVEETLLKFDGEKYNLLAWVIIPNHVHVLIECNFSIPLSKIIHSWKSFTASFANSLLQRKGKFWYPDYYDTFIRDEDHLEKAVNYIHFNPVKAGLVNEPFEWSFSSANRPDRLSTILTCD